MKPLVNNALIIGLFVIFALIAACGIYLVYASIQSSTPAEQRKPTDTKVDILVNNGGAKIKLSTAIPGMMVFLIGGGGLLVLAIRVPVKQIKGYKKPRTKTKDSTMNFELSMPSFEYLKAPEPILSEKTERIPILFWWLLQRKNVAVRV
ncbi:MAG TPA: hypothetical protein VMV56_10885 [Williamwhitmania sp.]|nr:hypothetical protein [Williamwhitmania sp.]